MERVLTFDMNRLWLASLRNTPRGIERVEFNFAEMLLEQWPGPIKGVCWTPWGIRVFDSSILRRLIEHIRNTWSEDTLSSNDPVYNALKVWVTQGGEFSLDKQAPMAIHRLARARAFLKSLRATGLHKGLPLISALPLNSIYLNIGHIGFMAPGLRKALKMRPDIHTVALIHDTVSLNDPQFFPEANEAYFAQILKRIAKRANLVLTTTEGGLQELDTAFRNFGPTPPKLGVVSMQSVFRQMPAFVADIALRQHPYFVLCGTREPRKNHMMILNIWRAMAQSNAIVPKLILVGGHGWGARHIEDFLENCVAVKDKIVRVERLSSPGLFNLIGNARALLSPSFSEGFGLPVSEALYLGTPVLASNIHAYRETTRGLAVLIDPLDGLKWRTEIEHLVVGEAIPIELQSLRSQKYKKTKSKHTSLLDWLSHG